MDAAGSARMPSGAVELSVEDLYCSFRDLQGHPLPVLAGISLSARENEFVAIVGPVRKAFFNDFLPGK